MPVNPQEFEAFSSANCHKFANIHALLEEARLIKSRISREPDPAAAQHKITDLHSQSHKIIRELMDGFMRIGATEPEAHQLYDQVYRNYTAPPPPREVTANASKNRAMAS